eukprot:78370-Pleurochrysis_carterae.AAC.1
MVIFGRSDCFSATRFAQLLFDCTNVLKYAAPTCLNAPPAPFATPTCNKEPSVQFGISLPTIHVRATLGDAAQLSSRPAHALRVLDMRAAVAHLVSKILSYIHLRTFLLTLSTHAHTQCLCVSRRVTVYERGRNTRRVGPVLALTFDLPL